MENLIEFLSGWLREEVEPREPKPEPQIKIKRREKHET